MKGAEEVKEEMEKWEDLTIRNDFIFSKTLQDKDLCKKLLEKLLKIKVGKIEYIEEQKTINVDYISKGIRLDLYVEDNKKIYDIEIQVSDNKDLGKRSRYYQSLIDLNSIEKGKTYRKLKDSYIIFICTFDPFGREMSKYEFIQCCKENKEIELEDGARRIFFNTRGYENEKDEDIKAILKYINGEKVENSFVKEVDTRVREVKESQLNRSEYMAIYMRELEKMEESFDRGLKQGIERGIEYGIEQGIDRGLKQGMQQGIINQIKSLMEFDVPIDKIIEKIKEQYNLTEEEIRKYL